MSSTAGNPSGGPPPLPKPKAAVQADKSAPATDAAAPALVQVAETPAVEKGAAAGSWMESPAVLISLSVVFSVLGLAAVVLLGIVMARRWSTQSHAEIAKGTPPPTATSSESTAATQPLPDGSSDKAEIGGAGSADGPVDDDTEPMSTTADPLDDLRGKNRLLPLPAWSDRPTKESRRWQRLAKVYVESPDKCDLAIKGSSNVLPAGCTWELELSDSPAARVWKARVKSANAVGETPPVASFWLAKQSLWFRWEPVRKRNGETAAMLRCCLLACTVGQTTETCRLSVPEKIAPIVLDIAAVPPRHVFPLARGEFPQDSQVFWDLRVHDLPDGAEASTARKLKAAAAAKLTLGGDAKDSDAGRLDVTIALDLRAEPGLWFTCETPLEYPKSGTEVRVERKQLNAASLAEFRGTWNETRVRNCDTEKANLESSRTSMSLERDRWQRDLDVSRRFLEAGGEKTAAIRLLEAKVPRLESDVNAATAKIAEVDKTLALQTRLGETAAKNLALGNRLAKLLADIKAKGRIECRVYAVVEGREVTILQTTGFEEESAK